MNHHERYKLRFKNNNQSISQTRKNSTKNLVNNLFYNSSNYTRVRVSDIEKDCLLVQGKTFADKQLQFLPEEDISIGEYVNILDDIWLIVDINIDVNDLFPVAKIRKCNADLKWIDDNGEVKSFPCIFEHNTRSNFGVRDDKFMTMPDERRQVIVQRNEHTSLLGRNRRYIFDSRAFSTIDFDSLSDEGLVNIILEGDTETSDDNLELGIADYYSRIKNEDPPSPTPPPGELSIIINGSDSIRFGQSQTYVATVYSDEVETENDVEWSLYADNGVDSTNLASITFQDGSSCVVKNNNSNSGYVRLVCRLAEDDSVVVEKRIQMRSVF